MFMLAGALLLPLTAASVLPSVVPSLCSVVISAAHLILILVLQCNSGIGFASASELNCRDARAVHMTRCWSASKKKNVESMQQSVQNDTTVERSCIAVSFEKIVPSS